MTCSVQLARRAEQHGAALEFIQPGKPTQNSYVERFNLTIISPQDWDLYSSSASSSTAGAWVGWNLNTWSPRGGVSASASTEKVKSTYVSVGDELSGIKAGDGGFNITVGGQTTLVGSVIAPSQSAVERNLNYFSTNGLYIADLLNLSHYDASSTSFSASLAYDPNGGGMWKGFTPGGAPLALGASEKASGMSYSGISAGTIINNGQITFVDSLGKPINTMVRTGDPSGKIENVFDLKKIQSELAIGAALSQEAGLFLSNVAKDYPETWGDGKPARLLFTALVGGLTGNLSGSGMDVLQSAAGSVIQGLGAKEIKELLSALPEGDPKTEALRAGLQALAGCAGGAPTGNCASGALGAASSVVLIHLFELLTTDKVSSLTQAQKDQLTSLVTSIIAGTATALGGNAGAASLAARIEAENNAGAPEEDDNEERFFDPKNPKGVGVPGYGYFDPEYYYNSWAKMPRDEKLSAPEPDPDQTTDEQSGTSKEESVPPTPVLPTLPSFTEETVPNRTVNQADLDTLTANGVKFTPQNVVATGTTPNGQVVFLETGNSAAGLQHIIEQHASDDNVQKVSHI